MIALYVITAVMINQPGLFFSIFVDIHLILSPSDHHTNEKWVEASIKNMLW